jgi:SAM-dependent MidA family methyltransferase
MTDTKAKITTPLEHEIRRLIRIAGPMPVSRYMELCLTHPQHGYYTTREPLGREGDFITAPEVSQMFGELLGLWAASVWKQMGSPRAINLVELGPGRGTMMMDALRAIRVLPAFLQAVSVHLVEINPVLREAQKKTLSATKAQITWYDRLDDVPEGPAIILANEFFDALPIAQAVRTEHGWHERVVIVDDKDALAFAAADHPLPRFDLLVPAVVNAAPVGSICEWRTNDAAIQLARRLRLSGGVVLIIDYGPLRGAAGDTLQAVARHAYVDPLKHPGTADITAHVDFQALAQAAEDAGARVHGPIEQGEFLRRLGIESRATSLMAKAPSDVIDDIAHAMRRLTGSGRANMGSLFKVLALSDPALKTLPAFDENAGGTEPAR